MYNKPSAFIFALFAFVALVTALPAHANLTIMPIRVLMQDRDRSAELTLVNTSETINTYRLEWGHRRMLESGGYENLAEPLSPVFNPDESIRFSPRQVTIAPGQSQRIRLSLRKPADLPDGEYRAHLVFKQVSSGSRVQRKGGQDGVAAVMSANVGFSIPVVVRQGPYDGGVTITDPQFIQPTRPEDPPRMVVTLDRTGSHSVTGAVRVYWTPPGGRERRVGQANNVNVFNEIGRRVIGVGLKESNITSGKIRIAFEGLNEQKGKILAEKSFPIGQ